MIAAFIDRLTVTYSESMVGVYDGLGSVWPLSPHQEHPAVSVAARDARWLRSADRVSFVVASFADGRREARRIRWMR